MSFLTITIAKRRPKNILNLKEDFGKSAQTLSPPCSLIYILRLLINLSSFPKWKPPAVLRFFFFSPSFADRKWNSVSSVADCWWHSFPSPFFLHSNAHFLTEAKAKVSKTLPAWSTLLPVSLHITGALTLIHRSGINTFEVPLLPEASGPSFVQIPLDRRMALHCSFRSQH